MPQQRYEYETFISNDDESLEKLLNRGAKESGGKLHSFWYHPGVMSFPGYYVVVFENAIKPTDGVM